MPDEEELREQSSMTYWWPKLQSVDVPVPETVEVGLESIVIDDGAPDTDGTVTVDVADMDELIEAIQTVDGPPAFLRSDQMSAKHRMADASKLTSLDEEELLGNRWELFEAHEMAWTVPKAEQYYVREWLDLYHEFTAFTGCPIAAEMRFFIYDNSMWDRDFYWPKDAIRRPDIVDWESAWEAAKDTAWEYEAEMTQLVERVATEFDGYWSIDVAVTMEKDLYCIDMARGELSWHPNGMEKPDGVSDPR